MTRARFVYKRSRPLASWTENILAYRTAKFLAIATPVVFGASYFREVPAPASGARSLYLSRRYLAILKAHATRSPARRRG